MKFMAVCVVLLLVSACTNQGSDTSTVPVEPSIPESVEADWLIHTNGTRVTSAAALIIGTLDIDVESRCVTVVSELGVALVVFIDGATLDITDPNEPVLNRYLGDTYRDGQHIEWGGGYGWGLIDSDDPAYSDIVLPDTCEYDGVWMMAQGV